MAMRFGPTRIPAYSRSAPSTPYGAEEDQPHDPYAGMTPAIPGAPAFNPGGGGGGVSPFQASVNTQRANDANRAATFAAAAPLPMMQAAAAPAPADAAQYGRAGGGTPFTSAPNDPAQYGRGGGGTPFTDPTPVAAAGPGTYSGAFGTGPQAQQAAQAARSAFVANANSVANQNSGGYFLNAAMAGDANSRLNASSDAQNAWIGAKARNVDANSTIMIPAAAGELNSRSTFVLGQNRRDDDMAPYQQQEAAAGIAGQTVLNQLRAAGIPYVSRQNDADLAQKDAELARYKGMTDPTIRGAGEAAGMTTGLMQKQRDMLRDEEGFLKQKVDAANGARDQVDPKAAVDLLAQRQKLAAETAKQRYEDQDHVLGIFPRSWKKGYRDLSDLEKEEFQKQAPDLPFPSKAAAPRAMPPEGTKSVYQDGRPVVVRGGKWVYQS